MPVHHGAAACLLFGACSPSGALHKSCWPPGAPLQLTLVRLDAEVPVRADTLFARLTSMPGKRLIDPFPREQHSVPVQVGPGGGGTGAVQVRAVQV